MPKLLNTLSCVFNIPRHQAASILDYFAVTVKMTAGAFLTPAIEVFISTPPTSTPVTKPPSDMVATAVFEVSQKTSEVISPVTPF